MAISGPGPSEVAPPNSSGIKVIIVGLGMGGLAAAIECHRKGHTVSAFDKVDVKSFVREWESVAPSSSIRRS
jgi:UDP-N-acetylmuramoylalanine-D-glutamate ligase